MDSDPRLVVFFIILSTNPKMLQMMNILVPVPNHPVESKILSPELLLQERWSRIFTVFDNGQSNIVSRRPRRLAYATASGAGCESACEIPLPSTSLKYSPPGWNSTNKGALERRDRDLDKSLGRFWTKRSSLIRNWTSDVAIWRDSRRFPHCDRWTRDHRGSSLFSIKFSLSYFF